MRAVHHPAETGFIPPSARRRSQFATLPDNPSADEPAEAAAHPASHPGAGPPSGACRKTGVNRCEVERSRTPY